MVRRLAFLLLAPLLASCQLPDHTVRAVFVGNALAFVAADSGDSDASVCWREGTVIDDSLRPVWGFSGPGTGECREPFPLFYGRPPAGTQTTVRASTFEPGRLYLFISQSTPRVSGAFSFSKAGSRWIVHNVDTDSPAAGAIQTRWWRQWNASPRAAGSGAGT